MSNHIYHVLPSPEICISLVHFPTRLRSSQHLTDLLVSYRTGSVLFFRFIVPCRQELRRITNICCLAGFYYFIALVYLRDVNSVNLEHRYDFSVLMEIHSFIIIIILINIMGQSSTNRLSSVVSISSSRYSL